MRDLNGERNDKVTKDVADSLGKAISAYRNSPDFTGCAPKTKKDYIRYLDFLRENLGDLSLASIDREAVLALRNELAEKPRSADYTIALLRRVTMPPENSLF